MRSDSDRDIIEFVHKITEAITVISRSTEAMNATLSALKDSHMEHSMEVVAGLQLAKDKMDNLKVIFLYVITPLIAGILGLVGVKLLFSLPT